jgi:hypothetical protein
MAPALPLFFEDVAAFFKVAGITTNAEAGLAKVSVGVSDVLVTVMLTVAVADA